MAEIQTEWAFISQIMIDPDIILKTTIKPEMFEAEKNRKIFEASVHLMGKNVPPGVVTINALNQEISLKYLAEISGMECSSANWKYFEGQIIDSWKEKKLQMLGKRLDRENLTNEEKLQLIDSELLGIDLESTKLEIKLASKEIDEVINKVRVKFENPNKKFDYQSGIKALDDVIGGFSDGEYIVIGGRPSDGKSAIGLNIILKLALKDNLPVGIISSESGIKEILQRSLSSLSSIDNFRLRQGYLKKDDFITLSKVATDIKKTTIPIMDKPNATIQEVKSSAKLMKKLYGIKVLLIDYVQLIKVPKSRTRIEEIETASKECKELARLLNIPVIALAQLTRPEKDAKNAKEPSLSDFKGSGQIEQDADMAILLHHRRNPVDRAEILESNLLVLKQRNGGLARIPVDFEGKYVRFEDCKGKPSLTGNKSSIGEEKDE
jgi:replicative DNA helicase